MDGHVAVGIPCDNNGKPLLDVLAGIAGDRTFMRPVLLHHVASMDALGITCMYHANIASQMGPNGWYVNDIILHNPSNHEITLPQGSEAIVAVNEIMKDPGLGPATQGSMTMEQRGGGEGLASMNNNMNMTNTSTMNSMNNMSLSSR